MAAKQKHRLAGNPYNLRKKVEIPVEIQLENDSAFLHEFASQPIPGQVLGSQTGSDTDSTSTDESTGLNISGVVYSESDLEKSPVVKHRKHFKNSILHPVASTSKMSDQREEKLPDQALINQRILSQLDAIGKRLTVIEHKSASPAKPKAKKLTKKKGTASSSLKHSSVEEVGSDMPSLYTLRNDRSIQDQIQDRLRELSGVDKRGMDQKIKSQRGGAVDIFVKEKVKWPHEYVLAGNTKDRITYNQLNITQWMAGFCRIMKEESCQITKNHMLEYLIALLDYSNDFSWQAAKASHAVLLCRMEQGEVTSWSETDKIDRIRRANAQRHVLPTQNNVGSQKFRKTQNPQKSIKSMPCVYYNDNSCNFNKNHETKGVFYRYICSTCFAQDGKVNTHSALDCKQKRTKNE